MTLLRIKFRVSCGEPQPLPPRAKHNQKEGKGSIWPLPDGHSFCVHLTAAGRCDRVFALRNLTLAVTGSTLDGAIVASVLAESDADISVVVIVIDNSTLNAASIVGTSIHDAATPPGPPASRRPRGMT